jgi:Fanconi anemia group M protein
MTASPGYSSQRILAVCKNLGIQRVDIRTIDDENVRPYVYGSTIEWELIDLPPEFIKIKQALMEVLETHVKGLQKYGFLKRRKATAVTKSELLRVQKEAQAKHLFNFVAKKSPS